MKLSIVDARLEDGSRVSVVLPPIALMISILTIRKFPDKPMTMEQLLHMVRSLKKPPQFWNIWLGKYNIFICEVQVQVNYLLNAFQFYSR